MDFCMLILYSATLLNTHILGLFWKSLLVFYLDNNDNTFFWIYMFFHQLDYEGHWALYVSVLHK